MLSHQQIKELEELLEILNQKALPLKEDLEERVEDVNYLLKTLTKVKVSRIKKLMDPLSNKVGKSDKLPNELSYSREFVLQLFRTIKTDEIVKNYTLLQIQEMFAVVYGKKPPSKETKKTITEAIKGMSHQIERANGFREMENAAKK